jgi:hypothetical protein
MARTNQRGSKTNNPEGRNQYSGWRETAKDRPMAAASLAAAAVGAGVFLWSRRNQISDQITNLSEQLGEWRESFGTTGETFAGDSGETTGFIASPKGRRDRKSQSEIAEEALTLKETGAPV